MGAENKQYKGGIIMEELLAYYDNDIPEEFIQEVIKEQSTIISRVKSHDTITEEQYVQEFIKSHPTMTVEDMVLWERVIHEAFFYGIFYYSTDHKYGNQDIYLK
jgi:hypothetical protein